MIINKKGFPGFKPGFKITDKDENLVSGLYHFRKTDQDNDSRLHLRIDPDGSGTLVINASSILHLNPTAALIAYFHLEGYLQVQIKKRINQVFDLVDEDIDRDIQLITADLDGFINANGKPVLTQSGVEINTPFSRLKYKWPETI
jgi:hypothetical protein